MDSAFSSTLDTGQVRGWLRLESKRMVQFFLGGRGRNKLLGVHRLTQVTPRREEKGLEHDKVDG